MSQSATLYRISQKDFDQLNVSGSASEFDFNSAKSVATFQGTFMAIEFLLGKYQKDSVVEVIGKIFNPQQLLGGKNLENLTPEEEFELYETGAFITYLDPAIISKVSSILKPLSPGDFGLKYDATELNTNGIYPEVWHSDESSDSAYNKVHIVNDFIILQYKRNISRSMA